jgi:predicted metal-dependent HD superfamily phosphohydrolase
MTDLTVRFEHLLSRLGGRPDPALAESLATAWGEPHRVYHGPDHLRDCLRQLDEAASDTADSGVPEAALWFHDAVYDPRGQDNEDRSAEWARRALPAAGIAHPTAEEVARLVLLTRHRDPPEAADRSGQLVCDVDLSILGRSPAEYDAFERQIRREYAWVPESIYRAERARILARFLDREPLYLTPHFRHRYETAARGNLQRALQRLGPPTRDRSW